MRRTPHVPTALPTVQIYIVYKTVCAPYPASGHHLHGKGCRPPLAACARPAGLYDLCNAGAEGSGKGVPHTASTLRPHPSRRVHTTKQPTAERSVTQTGLPQRCWGPTTGTQQRGALGPQLLLLLETTSITLDQSGALLGAGSAPGAPSPPPTKECHHNQPSPPFCQTLQLAAKQRLRPREPVPAHNTRAPPAVPKPLNCSAPAAVQKCQLGSQLGTTAAGARLASLHPHTHSTAHTQGGCSCMLQHTWG
jgi:hypothetical protein